MGNLKSLTLLALLISLSLAVFADTSTDATHAKDEVNPSTEATDAIEPQQRGGCRYGCCGSFAFGRCSACCSQPQAVEAEAVEADVVNPQQGIGGGGGGFGGCRYGCCGGWFRGRCRYCCRSQAEANEVVETVEPQQSRGCRYGCCGSFAYGQCSACCSRPQAVDTEAVEANVVDPQQGMGGGGGGSFGGCRYGCCGGWFRGRCRYCCRSQAEANEVVETVEPQQRRGCRYGCCGSFAYGQCSACCSKMAAEGEKKKEEAKP